MFISKSLYSDMDKEILLEEYKNFRNIVRSYNTLTPNYVYALCDSNGEPFYFGEGKNYRAFDHIKNYINNKLTNKYIKKKIDSLNSPPIIHIVKGNITKSDALELEKCLVSKYGRFFEGGQLANIMPGGIAFNDLFMSSIGGKIGGRQTKDNNLGIFSPEYDRGSQTKLNWLSGIMDHIDFKSQGTVWGNNSVENSLGIFDPKYSDKKTEWSTMGGLAVHASGRAGGFASKKWRDSNKDTITENAAKGGKVGGKTTGSMLWWNNGVNNKKSFVQPIGFVRGMLMSDKKKSTLFGKKIKE